MPPYVLSFAEKENPHSKQIFFQNSKFVVFSLRQTRVSVPLQNHQTDPDLGPELYLSVSGIVPKYKGIEIPLG